MRENMLRHRNSPDLRKVNDLLRHNRGMLRHNSDILRTLRDVIALFFRTVLC